MPLSTAASGAGDKSSPFEGLQIAGAEEKPVQAPEKPAQGAKVRAAFSVWQQEQLRADYPSLELLDGLA